MKSKISKLKSILYTVFLVVALIIMISPFPEGTIILSFILSYFGYRLTTNFYTSVLIYLATFIVTLVLIRKLKLIERFKKQLKKTRR